MTDHSSPPGAHDDSVAHDRSDSPAGRDGQSGVSRRSFLRTAGVSAVAGAAAPLSANAREHAVDGLDAVDSASAIAAKTVGPDPAPTALNINGTKYEPVIEPATTLLDALRLKCGLTGSKQICDRGACGGCSVLVDGVLTASCMTLAGDAVGSEVTTIEGLASADGTLDPIQESFIRHDALQCGYCTPGFVIAAKALLNDNPKPTLAEIRKGLSGNICRCGTYTNMFNAVLEASGQPVIRDGAAGGEG